jgi:uroporphyrinogen-III synthase
MVIPALVPPLRGLSVIVTRPREQAEPLCTRIEQLGGEAIRLPSMAIAASEPAALALTEFDWIIFLSANAVQHGRHHISKSATTRIAAIGTATAAALASAGIPADLVPAAGSSSETLLAHPEFAATAGTRILVVRGVGGRELLLQTLRERGAVIAVLEVYQRQLAVPDPAYLAEIESTWQEGGTWVATATSVEALENLARLLSAAGRKLLQATTLVVASSRIESAAQALGLQGEILLAPGADDLATIGTLERWQTRARVVQVRQASGNFVV